MDRPVPINQSGTMDQHRRKEEAKYSDSEEGKCTSSNDEQPEVPLSSSAAGTTIHEDPGAEKVTAEEAPQRPAASPPSSYRPTDYRKSPPTNSHAVFATPAPSGSAAMRRKSDSSFSSMKKAPTPNPVFSTPMSTPGSKTQRGLRHFSILVCKHVEQMGTTTYNKVADELVSQAISDRDPDAPKGKFDEKNIRRRVYDALNVLLAMDIITKDKKDIIWKGLPRNGVPPAEEEEAEEEETEEAKESGASPKGPIYTDAAEYDEHEFAAMQREREYLEAEVARKQEALREILVQQVCFRNLVMRNQRREYPSPGSPHNPPPEDEKIPLPFIISNTRPSAVVQCDMNKEKTDVMFDFDSPFEINDDNTILKRMEMDRTTVYALQGMLPEDMFEYCHHTGILDSVLLPGENPNSSARVPHYQAYDRSHYNRYRY